jgi:hypothetical protein
MSDATPFYGSASGVVEPVIQPQGTDLDGNNYPTDMQGGVGSFQLLSDPETPQEFKCIFTGWAPDQNDNRHLFSADFDDVEMGIRNPTKILDAFTLGKVEGAYGFYDRANDEWVLGMTTTGNTGLYLLAVSGDLSSVNTYQGYSVATKDSGATALGVWQNGTLYIQSIADSDRHLNVWEVQSDYSTRPFSSSISNGQPLIKSPSWLVTDVFHSSWSNDGGVQIVFENRNSKSDQWTLHPAWTGPANAEITNTGAWVSKRGLIPSGFSGGGGDFGHPFFDVMHGRPTVFFDWFRDLNTSNLETFRHELWAVEVDADWLHPSGERWWPLHAQTHDGESGGTEFYNTFGADSLTLYLDTNNTVTVTLREAGSGDQINSGSFAERTVFSSVSSGQHVTTIDNPAPAIQLNCNASVSSLEATLTR